jgi:hypothetical protein
VSQLFTYHVATLPELIESKPCVWDKTSDSYKDKSEKSKTWREICAFLEGDFHQMDRNKQQKISKYTYINTF